MASRESSFTIHPALGGLDVASDPTILDPNFLTVADNIEYREGGQRRKRQGFSIYSSGATSTGTGNFVQASTATVRALADYWSYAGGVPPSQIWLAVADNWIYKSTGDGKWVQSTLAAGSTLSTAFGTATSKQTLITLANNYAVISDGASPPVVFSTAGVTNLSTTPAFSTATFHLARLWYSGYTSSPSQITFTAADNIFDSTGADAGTAKINDGDGDQIIGISKPFYGSLYLFKGPQFGSVHQLSGQTPATFAVAQVAFGAPLQNARGLSSTPTDIYWISNYGIHSLETTVKFGNVEQAFLSLPIQKFWRDGTMTNASLDQAWGFWDPARNVVGWVVTVAGGLQTLAFLYNYALSDPKPGGKKFWSVWKLGTLSLKSGTVALLPSGIASQYGNTGEPRLIVGTSGGLVYVGNQSGFQDAGTNYQARVRTPLLTKFSQRDGGPPIPETQEKSFSGIVTYYNPVGGNDPVTLTVTIDDRTQVASVPLMGTGATLGPGGTFKLGASTLGGLAFNFVETPEISDRGRGIFLTWDQGSSGGMELLGYSIRYLAGEKAAKDGS